MNKDLNIFLLRVGLGVMFFWAGFDKVTAPFTAAGFLNSSTGPFAETFKSLAGNTSIDFLVTWGLILGGAALILGIFTKVATVGLSIMMVLFYLSHFPPAAPNHLVDDHILYILALALLWNLESENFWGLAKFIKVPVFFR